MRAFKVKKETPGFLIIHSGKERAVNPFTTTKDQLYMVEDIHFDPVSVHNAVIQFDQTPLDASEQQFVNEGYMGFKAGNANQRKAYTLVIHTSKVEVM